MKKLLFFLVVFLLGCKSSHIFYNLLNDTEAFKDSKSTYKNIKLEDYTVYYNVTFREDGKLEEICSNCTSPGDKVHITDIQYLLVSNKSDHFIHISNVPMRYTSGKNSYYLDKYAKEYSQQINLYYANQIFIGKITGNTLNYRYKTAKFKRDKKKQVDITFSVGGPTLTLQTIKKENYDSFCSLSNIVNANHLTFKKMSNPQLILYGAEEDILYPFRNDFSFTTYNKRICGRILSPLGQGRRNMILFYFDKQIIDGDSKIDGIWFGETKERFKYFYP